LRPAPSNLAEREYTNEQLADILWNGVLGTAMPAWRDQPPSHLAALVDVVRSFAVAAAEIAPSAEQLTLGRRVYAGNCAECHGATGAGDGFAANDLPIAPTNFQGERPSLAESVRVLQSGIEGTSMAPWTDRLDAEEMLAVAHYVRQFFEGDRR
jgi:mono/diheme cytochrome c family protein